MIVIQFYEFIGDFMKMNKKSLTHTAHFKLVYRQWRGIDLCVWTEKIFASIS